MSVLETHTFSPIRPGSPLLFALWLSLILSPSAFGQAAVQTGQPEAPPAAPQARSSLRLESISLFTGYYSGGYDVGATQGANPNALGADVIVGSSALVRWNRPTERSDLFVTYSTDYSGHVRYSGWQNLSHHLSLNFSRQFARWDFRISAAAALTTTEQMLFEQNNLSNVAAVRSTFDDLATGIMRGTFPNKALAPVLTGAQAVVSPTLLLYGTRSLTTTAQLAATHHVSPLTTISFSVGATRNQGLPFSDTAAAAGATPFLGSVTVGNASVGISHSLSPRTQVAFTFGTSRTFSRLEDAYYNTGSVSITHTLNEHWFAGVHAGGGNIVPIRQTTNASTVAPYLAGGNLGYKMFAHTFLVSYERTFTDTYGLGAASSIATTGAWIWSRPGGTWRLSASVGQQQIENGAFAALDTWQVTVSLRKMLTPHAALTAEYGYLRYTGGPTALTEALSPSAVRLIVSWAPGLGLLP